MPNTRRTAETSPEQPWTFSRNDIFRISSQVCAASVPSFSAAPGVVGLSLEVDQMSATYLSKAVQILVRRKYAADCNTGTSPEDKSQVWLPRLQRLSKQVRRPSEYFPLTFFRAGSITRLTFGKAKPDLRREEDPRFRIFSGIHVNHLYRLWPGSRNERIVVQQRGPSKHK